MQSFYIFPISKQTLLHLLSFLYVGHALLLLLRKGFCVPDLDYQSVLTGCQHDRTLLDEFYSDTFPPNCFLVLQLLDGTLIHLSTIPSSSVMILSSVFRHISAYGMELHIPGLTGFLVELRAAVMNLVDFGQVLAHFCHHQVAIRVDVRATVGSDVDYVQGVPILLFGDLQLYLPWRLCWEKTLRMAMFLEVANSLSHRNITFTSTATC